ncbi:MAG: ABC transporter ATP-binding protein [Mariprofundaceae bacterium]
MNPLLEVRDVCLSVPTGHVIQGRKQVLDHVDFSVARGSATAYLGANGAGKTSTFRILCGLCRSDAGEVFYDGCEVHGGLSPEQFGFMPEQPYFYRNLTPFELLRGLARLSGVATQGLAAKIEAWAERLTFSTVLNQPLHACSKGQVQRVGLAQALLHQPQFVLLDEPLSGLDPMGRDQVKQVLRDIHAQGATLLFSSHILSDAEAICDAVVVLDEGRVVHQGKLADLIGGNHWVVTLEGDSNMFSELNPEKLEQNRFRLRVKNETQRDTLITRSLGLKQCRLLIVEQDKRTLEDAFVSLLKREEKT